MVADFVAGVEVEVWRRMLWTWLKEEAVEVEG